jgi:predicted amidophosphoribosyltransferase
MAKGCLYCGLQLPEAAEFCPQCGRPLERGFKIRPIQESEFDRLHKEMKGLWSTDASSQKGHSRGSHCAPLG